jgi:hypothetical protein
MNLDVLGFLLFVGLYFFACFLFFRDGEYIGTEDSVGENAVNGMVAFLLAGEYELYEIVGGGCEGCGEGVGGKYIFCLGE